MSPVRWRRALLLGLAMGALLAAVASLVYSANYIARRDYLLSDLPSIGGTLLLHPWIALFGPLAALGVAAAALVRASGRRWRLTAGLFCFALVGIGGALIRANYYIPLPRAIPWPALLVAAALVAGGVAMVMARPASRALSRAPAGWIVLGAVAPYAVLGALDLWGNPACRTGSAPAGDRAFLALFDRRAPGLETAFARLDRGDVSAAVDAVVEHFRTRQPPPLLSPLAAATAGELACADSTLAHRYNISGVRYQEPARIDWTGGGVRDPEFAYALNRHLEWTALAAAELRTGDEAYAREIANQARDWIAGNPPLGWRDDASPSWRLVDCALRLRDAWIPAVDAVRSHPSLDRAFWVALLRSVDEQAEFLAHFRSEANHLVMESGSLLEISLHFPEFRRSAVWRRIARNRVEQQLRRQVFADGVHAELSPAYHHLVLMELTRVLEVMKLHHLAVPREFSSRIEQMWDYLASIVQPDGGFPNLNDGTPLRIADDILAAADEFHREDFRYAATAGRSGVAPSWTCRVFPQAGQALLRTGWKPEDLFLLFDAGAFGGAHGHEDKLSVTCWGGGHPWLVDNGSYTYDSGNPFRSYFVGSDAHNSVLVDDCGQARRVDPESYNLKPGSPPYFHDGAEAAYAEGRYDQGYLYRGSWKKPHDRSIHHVRGVLFVKPDYWILLDRLEGTGRHSHTRLFHFAPGQARSLPDGAMTAFPQGGNLLVLAAEHGAVQVSIVSGGLKPRQGWYATGYNEKVPAPAVEIRGEDSLPCALATVLLPCGETESPELPVLRSTRLPGGGLVVQVQRGADQDVVVWPPPGATFWSEAGLEGKGPIRVALVRRVGEGAPRIFVAGAGSVRMVDAGGIGDR